MPPPPAPPSIADDRSTVIVDEEHSARSLTPPPESISGIVRAPVDVAVSSVLIPDDVVRASVTPQRRTSFHGSGGKPASYVSDEDDEKRPSPKAEKGKGFPTSYYVIIGVALIGLAYITD